MIRQPVSSSNIASIGWEPGNDDEEGTIGVLEVEFRNGWVYEYDNVPEQVFNEFVGASSVGKYLNEHIIDQYQHTRTK